MIDDPKRLPTADHPHASQSNGSPRMSEHDEQCAFVEYVRARSNQVPELRWLHAVPNGGARNITVARKMKAEGVIRGVWDIHLPLARGGYKGLYIEFKFGRNKLTPEQREFGAFVEGQGFKTGVAYSAEEGIRILEDYLRGVT